MAFLVLAASFCCLSAFAEDGTIYETAGELWGRESGGTLYKNTGEIWGRVTGGGTNYFLEMGDIPWSTVSSSN